MQEIEELGRLQFSIPEISIILGIDELSFTNEMMKARNRGRLNGFIGGSQVYFAAGYKRVHSGAEANDGFD